MNRSLLVLCCLYILACTTLSAQTVRGLVLDSDTKAPIDAAYVLLTDTLTDVTQSAILSADGRFSIPVVAERVYDLNISYLGYSDLNRIITTDAVGYTDTFYLSNAATKLGMIEVVAPPVAVVVNGDTLEFNADAYNVSANASVGDLLEEMRTIEVDDQGNITAQGEEVQEVIVDGKQFFSGEAQQALDNLPAAAVEKVQVYDEKTEESDVTGVDDGERKKVLNIVTKAAVKKGRFGKLFAGGGTADRYEAGGSMNMYRDEQKLSIIAQTNNLNQRNFNYGDMRELGFSGGTWYDNGDGTYTNPGYSWNDNLQGITRTTALGVNYSNDWMKNKKGARITASYFFTNSDNRAQYLTERTFADGDNPELYTEEGNTTRISNSHRATANFRYRPDTLNRIVVMPTVEWSTQDNTNAYAGLRTQDAMLLGSTVNRNEQTDNQLSISGRASWYQGAKSRSWAYSASVNGRYAPSDNEGLRFSLNEAVSIANDTLDQRTELDRARNYLNANGSITRKLSEQWRIQLGHNQRYNEQDERQLTLAFDPVTELYSILEPDLSNEFTTITTTTAPFVRLSFKPREKASISLTLRNETTLLDNDVQSGPGQSLQQQYNNWTYSLNVWQQYEGKGNLWGRIRSNVRIPSATQLRSVIDNSNPLQLRTGNPELVPSITHQGYGNFYNYDNETGRYFSVGFNASATTNTVSQATFRFGEAWPADIDLEPLAGARLTRPVNVGSSYRAGIDGDYDFDIKAADLRVDLNADYNYSWIPSIIDGQANDTERHSYSGGMGLSYEPVKTFRISVGGNYRGSRAEYSLATLPNQDNATITYRLNVRWTISKGFELRSNLNQTQYQGFGEDFDQDFLRWDVYIEKTFLEDERLAIQLRAFDLLNNNNNVERNITEIFIEDVQSDVLRRYAMLRLSYRFKKWSVGEEKKGDGEVIILN